MAWIGEILGLELGCSLVVCCRLKPLQAQTNCVQKEPLLSAISVKPLWAGMPSITQKESGLLLSTVNREVPSAWCTSKLCSTGH